MRRKKQVDAVAIGSDPIRVAKSHLDLWQRPAEIIILHRCNRRQVDNRISASAEHPGIVRDFAKAAANLANARSWHRACFDHTKCGIKSLNVAAVQYSAAD